LIFKKWDYFSKQRHFFEPKTPQINTVCDLLILENSVSTSHFYSLIFESLKTKLESINSCLFSVISYSGSITFGDIQGDQHTFAIQETFGFTSALSFSVSHLFFDLATQKDLLINYIDCLKTPKPTNAPLSFVEIIDFLAPFEDSFVNVCFIIVEREGEVERQCAREIKCLLDSKSMLIALNIPKHDRATIRNDGE
jgi:hypothetical protein